MDKRKIVLIIDDESFFMSAIRERLKSYGVDSLQLTNIKRAVNYLETGLNNLDLILIDLMIPFGRGHNFNITKYVPPGKKIIEFLLEKKFDPSKFIVFSAKEDLLIQKLCKEQNIIYLSKANKDDSETLDKLFKQLKVK